MFCALAGHPLVCSNYSNCQSKLRLLRAVATHCPKLVTFMHQLYIVIRSLKVLEEIDKALWTGDLEYLISVSRVEGQLGKLFSKEVDVVSGSLSDRNIWGEYHPRQSILGFSENVKSRLLNNDDCLRKNAQYVFYLLWQKEMREV